MSNARIARCRYNGAGTAAVKPHQRPGRQDEFGKSGAWPRYCWTSLEERLITSTSLDVQIGTEGHRTIRDLQQHVFRPAAEAVKIYHPGFGMHVFRRLNITWRQHAGASPFEAQKAAGHARPSTTWMYTIT